MKRIKRKYTRKAIPEETGSNGTEGGVFPPVSLSGGIPEGMVLPESVTTTTGGEFTYTDLPLSVRMGVENTIKQRGRLHLPDDSKERKEQAIKYFRGDRPR
mgnify:CR=1 FL=1